MAKNNLKSVQKVQKVQKQNVKSAQKIQKAPPAVKNDKAFVKKVAQVANNKKNAVKLGGKGKNKGIGSLVPKKEVESDEEEEDEEDSGADVVADEVEDESDEVEEDEDDSEEISMDRTIKIEKDDDEEDDDDEDEQDDEEEDDEDESDSNNDAPMEAPIAKKKLTDGKSKEAPAKKKGSQLKTNVESRTPNECTVCAKNLPENIDEKDLKDHFKGCGDIERLTIKRERNYAFIAFENTSAAQAALKLHNSQLKGHNISVYPKVTNPREFSIKDPKKTVLLSNVDNIPSVSADKLTEIFSECGEIAELEILCKKNVLAFITYKSEESAKKCKELHGKTINNIKIQLDDFQLLPQKSKTTIFVQNVKPGTTTKEIEELFAVAGPIESTFVKSGFAIVKFKDTDGYCKSFLLNETMLRGQMIFLEPHSEKKQFALRKKNFAGKKRPLPPHKNSNGSPFKGGNPHKGLNNNPHKANNSNPHKGGNPKRFKKN